MARKKLESSAVPSFAKEKKACRKGFTAVNLTIGGKEVLDRIVAHHRKRLGPDFSIGMGRLMEAILRAEADRLGL